MTTERSLFCSEEEFVALKAKAAPLAALLIALPFAAGTKPGHPEIGVLKLDIVIRNQVVITAFLM